MSAEQKPVIQFIGMSVGTLETSLDALEFTEKFDTTDHTLVGAVQFAEVLEGTKVQATWFSPDERRMPLGRTTIITESGAMVARFSINSDVDWTPTPYLLRIDAMYGEGEAMQTASGSTHFFIGMNDEEITSYHEEFRVWNEQKEKQRFEQEKKDQEKAEDPEEAEEVEELEELEELEEENIPQ